VDDGADWWRVLTQRIEAWRDGVEQAEGSGNGARKRSRANYEEEEQQQQQQHGEEDDEEKEEVDCRIPGGFHFSTNFRSLRGKGQGPSSRSPSWRQQRRRPRPHLFGRSAWFRCYCPPSSGISLPAFPDAKTHMLTTSIKSRHADPPAPERAFSAAQGIGRISASAGARDSRRIVGQGASAQQISIAPPQAPAHGSPVVGSAYSPLLGSPLGAPPPAPISSEDRQTSGAERRHRCRSLRMIQGTRFNSVMRKRRRLVIYLVASTVRSITTRRVL
jgi:hypothetical protein